MRGGAHDRLMNKLAAARHIDEEKRAATVGAMLEGDRNQTGRKESTLGRQGKEKLINN